MDSVSSSSSRAPSPLSEEKSVSEPSEGRGSFLKRSPRSEFSFPRTLSRLGLAESSKESEESLPFTPRAELEDVAESTKLIKERLGEDFPSCLSQVFAQVVLCQHIFISPDSHILIAGLEKMELLKPFLLGIYRLMILDSPLSFTVIERLVELGLRIVIHPNAQSLIQSGQVKKEIEALLTEAHHHLGNPAFEDLLRMAEEASILQEKKHTDSKDLAKEGLYHLTRLIRDPEDLKTFQAIQISYESDSFSLQKAFLFSVNTFLLKQNKLRLDELQKERIIQMSLNILLASEGTDLLRLVKIRKIAKLILNTPLLESPGKETVQLIRWMREKSKHSFCSPKRYSASQHLAIEGLTTLASCIKELKNQRTFEEIKDFHKTDPFALQRAFLFSVHFLVVKKNRLHLSDLQKESMIQLTSNIVLSPDGEKLLNTLKIKKIAKNILAMPLDRYTYPETEQLIQQATFQVSISFISLTEFLFLLFWIQSPLPNPETISHKIAGIRAWDPHGNLYLFTLNRCLELVQEPELEIDVMSHLLNFIACWRRTPANQDLLVKPTFGLAWKKFKSELGRRKELLEILGEIFFSKIEQTRGWPHQIHLPNKISDNPIFQFKGLSLSVPLKILPIWENKSIIREMRDTLVYHFLLPRQKVSTEDLSIHSKTPAASVSHLAKSFNRITQFVVSQLLASSGSSEFRRIVKVLCAVQNELLHHAAFEPALALHAAFQQKSINDLRAIYLDIPDYIEVFHNPNAVCHPQSKNSDALRKLQMLNSHSIDSSSMFLKDLIYLRENPPFTNQGSIDFSLLENLGKIFNDFITRRDAALSYWTETLSIDPHFFLLKAFDSQSGRIDDEQKDAWYYRSKEIHPTDSRTYWGINKPSSGGR